MRRLEQELYEDIHHAFPENEEDWKKRIHGIVMAAAKRCFYSLEERRSLAAQLYDAVCGYDFLSPFLKDPEITEIMVNGTCGVFVERNGRMERRETLPYTEEKLIRLVQNMVSGINRRVNASEPIVDARLEHGERVNVVLPPVSLVGPVITIRKFMEKPFRMKDLVGQGMMTEEAAAYLIKLVREKKNIFVSGSTGSGKTTFLNVLSSEIPVSERIVTIEDSAELNLPMAENLVRLEVRGKNLEGRNEITQRDLIKTALRMRPDRIIVGEVRGAEAIDMIQAMNTGHSGFSTGHANSAKDMLSRLETMVLIGEKMPLLAVRKQIAAAIHVIVHLERREEGKRRVKEIIEILGVEDDEYQIRWKYREGVFITEDRTGIEKIGENIAFGHWE